MKLNCNIEVRNRNATEPRRNPIKSVLALGKQPNNDDLFIMLFNSANKTGTKYLLKGNIEQIFTKFVNEGKTTIRFKTPPHDMLIQADNIQLKSFLKTLQMAFEQKIPLKELGLSNLSVTATKKSMVQTKLTITHRSDYPKNGFPRTLEVLKINGIARCSLDKGILYLQRLRILDLSNNLISSLPEEFNSLPNLRELNLSKNDFGKCRDWRWIGNNVAKTLIILDLSHNNLQFCPPNLNNLKCLITLNLSHNQLTTVPHNLATLYMLKTLNLSHNCLHYLPSSLSHLRFDWIDVSDNSFVRENCTLGRYSTKFSLFELAASAVLQYRLQFSPVTLPFTIIQFLHTAMFCLCGKATFSKRYRLVTDFYKKFIRSNTILASSSTPTIEVIFCSTNCYKKV